MTPLLHDLVSLASGSIVGFSLGLVGGGGSILAVPLLVYVVGVSSPHVAIGTSALAVAVNAAANIAPHARAGHVKWSCALVFAGSGVAGAALGSTLGQLVDGERLLTLFALVMFATAFSMVRRGRGAAIPEVTLTRKNAAQLLPRLIGLGMAVGVLAGFFGIGGGFLIVPGLILATSMPIINAIGSSLVGITAFGSTTAANYALAGLVDWRLAALFISGGILGGAIGAWAATRLATARNALNIVFAAVIAVVGAYMLARGLTGPVTF